uniref:Uncharacterized protein n=1 Tax=Panagrolaimus sp. ES5 TaxID=591445 RepID=A0AC34F7K9_9BILA
MEDMGKDQAKYLKNGINESNFEEYKWIELNEDEKQWLQRELQIQKQKVEENESELKKIVDETKALTKEFLNVIEETEKLLKKYAAIECKNMTTDLRNARLQILAAATKYEPETPMYKKYHEIIEESVMATEKPEFQELYTRKIANAETAAVEAEKYEQEMRKHKINIRKELYWMDKRPEDKLKVTEIIESIEKMDPNLLKEFLRAMVIGGSLSSNSELSEPTLSDSTATQMTEFLKQMTINRNRHFEIHLKACLQIYFEDIKKVSDEAADLENHVRSLEKNLIEMKKEKTKEEEFCERLKERIKNVEENAMKKKEKVKEGDDKSEKQWIKEIHYLEDKLSEATELREKARIENLNFQEKIRSAQIEENNLRHRFNVFQSLKNAEKEGRKQFENSEQLFEAEKSKNQKIIAETEMMSKILEEALKQEANLEKAIEKNFVQESVSEEYQALEAEKRELEAELKYLISIEQKINAKINAK